MKPDGHVLVIGAANLDVKARPDQAATPGTSTPGIIRSSVGGVARNIAENLARLEVETVLLTTVGNDDSGERILGHATASGINIASALIAEGERTGSYVALLTNNGALDIAIDDMGVLSSLTPTYLHSHKALFEAARLVAIDANLPPDSIQAVVKLCQQFDIPLCADPTSATLAVRLIPHLAKLHMISPNHLEAEVLTRTPIDPENREKSEAAAAGLVGLGVERAIITLGEQGVVYADAETVGYFPAVTGQTVDPTGAGDAMTAAIIFGLLEEIPLDECVKLGVTAATLTMRTREAVRPDLTVDLLYAELA
jgi:pseudouridine kinase